MKLQKVLWKQHIDFKIATEERVQPSLLSPLNTHWSDSKAPVTQSTERDHQGFPWQVNPSHLGHGAPAVTAGQWPTELGGFPRHCIQLLPGREGGWCDQGSSPWRGRIVTKTWMKTRVQIWLSRDTDKNISETPEKAPVHTIIVGWGRCVLHNSGKILYLEMSNTKTIFELWTTLPPPLPKCPETTRYTKIGLKVGDSS